MTPISTDSSLQFMPVYPDKKPIHAGWQNTKRNYDFSQAKAIGLVCGEISGNLEVLDIDLKYDLTGELYGKLKRAIKESNPDLLSKFVVQETQSKGYHFIYRCSVVSGSQKLASRYTVESEREQTYKKNYLSEMEKMKGPEFASLSQDEKIEKAVLIAVNQRDNDKVRVLLETRGEKGQIVVDPSPGYKIIFGSLDKISFISPEERETLFNICYSFNEVFKENHQEKKLPKKQTKGLTPSEDFNERGDVVALLISHGWTEAGKRGSKILMKRPGDTKAESSGNYDTEKNWFSVFTTSTEFEAQTPYKPYAVYCMLKCGGDFTKVTKMLADDGYGDKLELIAESKIEVPSIIDLADDDLSFLATEADYDDYLEKWRNGTFEKGQSTGMEGLDRHFLFKEGDLVIVNGIDNVGKSTVIWYLSLMAAIFNQWTWLIFSSENKVGGIVRKLIEFYWDKPIAELTDEQFYIAKKFVKEHFDIIKTSDKLFNYQDILKMTTKASRKKKYKGLMIDPYNSLKVDVPAKNKQSTYEYHYEAASVIQLYGKTNNISVYLNCHVGTTGARNKDKMGFTLAPQKEDTEMGVMFANKADEFLTVHRVTQHETEFMYTEIHVRKIKEIETGGKVTPLLRPVLLRANIGMTGFAQHASKLAGSRGQNPIREWHDSKLKDGQKSIFEPIDEYANVVYPESVPSTAKKISMPDMDTNEVDDEDIPF